MIHTAIGRWLIQHQLSTTKMAAEMLSHIPAALPAPSLAEICRLPLYLVFMSILEELIRKNKKISGVCELVDPVKTPDDEYDFIVVGVGAAGSVVAAKLSENPKFKILLLEAGPKQPVGAQVPMYMVPLSGTRVDWNYVTIGEPHACHATLGVCLIPAGKMLGGSMAHNGMVYTRGNPTDYNKWAELGNKGWEWDKVLPYFLKSEDNGEMKRVDKMAVVDPRLRVYGIKGLRVVDASIMPQPVTANTAAPSVMFGERAADFIKEDCDHQSEVTDDNPSSSASMHNQNPDTDKPVPLTLSVLGAKLTISL